MTISIYTDGAARGNPGAGGIGVLVTYLSARHQFKQYLGEVTNNQAEYQALLFALEKVRELILADQLDVEKIICYSDSELLVRQMQRKYKVKNAELGRLFIKVWNVMQQLPRIEFKEIPREENKEADKLASEAIDEQFAAIV